MTVSGIEHIIVITVISTHSNQYLTPSKYYRLTVINTQPLLNIIESMNPIFLRVRPEDFFINTITKGNIL